ncbi:hypothetical protein WMY93_029509 [Mugilogobius chulae]|uniref:Acyltransferase PGAP2 n=1 Tax=Mugilogobius chulae TaxID=88201 RepID=A0AAW0MT59_9GOBI
MIPPRTETPSSAASRMTTDLRPGPPAEDVAGAHATGPDRPLLWRISFRSCVVATLCLPLLGLLSCVFISSVYHFEDATGTHCHVANYLPSISASISLSPECHIWRACIGLHWAPRVLVEYSYLKLYRGRFGARSVERSLSTLSLIFSVCENMGLLLLTSVSSTEAYAVHKMGFLLFIGSSLVYMLITCRLWSAIKMQSFSLRMLGLIAGRNACYLLAPSFVVLLDSSTGNTTCTANLEVLLAYTMFALFEYLLVFSNMAFHLTAVWDFRGRDIVVVSSEDKHF